MQAAKDRIFNSEKTELSLKEISLKLESFNNHELEALRSLCFNIIYYRQHEVNKELTDFYKTNSTDINYGR